MPLALLAATFTPATEQPFSLWTNVTYILGGWWLLRRAPDSGLLLVLLGVSSLVFHALGTPGGGWAEAFDRVHMYLPFAYLAATGGRALLVDRERLLRVMDGLACLCVTATVAFQRRLPEPLPVFLTLGSLAFAWVLLVRTAAGQRPMQETLAIVGTQLLLFAAAVSALERRGDDMAHGTWHVLSAIALVGLHDALLPPWRAPPPWVLLAICSLSLTMLTLAYVMETSRVGWLVAWTVVLVGIAGGSFCSNVLRRIHL